MKALQKYSPQHADIAQLFKRIDDGKATEPVKQAIKLAILKEAFRGHPIQSTARGPLCEQ